MWKIIKTLRSGRTTTLVHMYKEIWKLHTSGVTRFLLVTMRGSTLQTVRRAFSNVWGVCGPGLLQRKGKKKILKHTLFRHLWLDSVTAWSAISSSPTEAVSCAAGRQPEQPPAPRTLAVGAGGLCSTWPHPGMTSAGRGKWTGRGGGETVPSHRLWKQEQVFHSFGL